jgi:4-alpha-glucanotransferase
MNLTPAVTSERQLVRAALAHLGIERLVFTVHDASFPANADEDVGRGSPYSRAAERLFEFVAARGFDAVQLGPQGKTSLDNPSPYDASVMARSHLSVALGRLVHDPGSAGLLPAPALRRAAAGRPPGSDARAQHRHAWQAILGGLRLAHRRYREKPAAFPALAEAEPDFRGRNADWLAADSLYEVLTDVHGTDDCSRWGRDASHDQFEHPVVGGSSAAARALLADHADTVAFNEFCQLVLQVQHDQLRTRLRALDLRLWADLQVGLGPRDRWRQQRLFLPGYALGAPPSRTTPQGQAWGYPVLDPQMFDHGGFGFFDRRVQRLLSDFDGLRIDHPHGIVCPWVYRTDLAEPGGDPLPAVRAGARLYASPDLPDHPALARYAIAARGDLAPAQETRPRHADDWVRTLAPAQIARYAQLLDRVMAAAHAPGAAAKEICAEILSTCPFPLAEVMKRHGLGRLRVVQKADPDDPRDPYRSETAAPADWITLGTHDTAPIWSVVDDWHAAEAAQQTRRDAWVRYLAERLAPGEANRVPLAARLGADPSALVGALAADLFVGPAARVTLFFADFLGLRAPYNVPGTIDDRNWTLRVPPDFAAAYARDRAAGRALDLTRALALALRARARGAVGDAADLAHALECL